MKVGDYHLFWMAGAGTDGVAYGARDLRDNALVEVRRLGAARARPDRWPVLRHRLKLLETLVHPAILRIRHLDLEADEPIVVLDTTHQPLAQSFQVEPWTLRERVLLVRALTGALAESHRLGVFHGALSPSRIGLTRDRAPQLDLTAIDAGGIEVGVMEEATFLAPEASRGRPIAASDLYSLGELLRQALEESEVLGIAPLSGERPAGPGIDVPALMQGIGLLLSAEPERRPPAHVVAAWLDGVLEPAPAREGRLSDTDGSRGASLATEVALEAHRATHVTDLREELAAQASAPVEGSLTPTGDGLSFTDRSLTPGTDESGITSWRPLRSLLASISDHALEESRREPTPALETSSEIEADLLQTVMPDGGSRAARPVTGGAVDATRAVTVRRMSETIGRFHLRRLLGEGASGAVYEAADIADGRKVALKALRPELVRVPEAVQRFQREARMLSQLNNPYVANLIEAGEDQGIHYLAMEYVEGRSLDLVLRERERLLESDALRIMSDVARGLADAHDLGIVHRDVKPANILLQRRDDPGDSLTVPSDELLATARVKLCDFGLARPVETIEELNVTRDGALLGTPYYMSPEQCRGDIVDARTDVYAMGVTLYRLLAGQPIFRANSTEALISMHLHDVPTPVNRIRPELSDGVTRLVARALEKAPELRYAHAREMLEDIERLLRGDPGRIDLHPRLADSALEECLSYDFSWDLQASPEALWPLVSNTDRVNHAIGLDPVESTATLKGGNVERHGRLRFAGMELNWLEHPYEWVEGRRFGVLREYSSGPFRWFRSVVELTPRQGGGTSLRQRIQVSPNGVLGRAAAAREIGYKAKRSLEKVYRRIDEVVRARAEVRLPAGGVLMAGARNTLAMDPFEEGARLSGEQRRRLTQLQDRLLEVGADPRVIDCLGAWLEQASAQEVARIRPIAFARRFGLPSDAVIRTLLFAAREGLLVLLWDLLCPICRVSSGLLETLQALRDHGHCPACNLDFKLDFAGSLELIFRVHPQIRAVDTATYCIGSPAHLPHVAAQVRLAPGERFELELSLSEGVYRLAGPQLPATVMLRVQAGAPLGRADVRLKRGGPANLSYVLAAGRQVVTVTNDFDHEILIRIERTADRDDAFTAARAACLPLFRELFPGEILAPGYLVSVASISLLITEAVAAGALMEGEGDGPGEERAFSVLHDHFRRLAERIGREGGAVVKILGDGVLASFPDPSSAVRTAFSLGDLAVHEDGGRLELKAGVHAGTAMVVTLNDRLDYFGKTVRQTARLLELAERGQVVVTEAVARDPGVVELLSGRPPGELVDGTGGLLAQRLSI